MASRSMTQSATTRAVCFCPNCGKQFSTRVMIRHKNMCRENLNRIPDTPITDLTSNTPSTGLTSNTPSNGLASNAPINGVTTNQSPIDAEELLSILGDTDSTQDIKSLLLIFKGFMDSVNVKFSDVHKSIKNIGRFVHSKEAINSYYDELDTLTEQFLKFENHVLILNNYKDSGNIPPSLSCGNFPKPVFCDFGYSQDYIDKYNNVINNCQNSLIELNTKTLTDKMTYNKGRIDEIKSTLQDVSDIDINSHIQELHRNKSSELKPDFDTANEKYLRTIQNQNKSFKVRTFKERKSLEIDSDEECNNSKTVNFNSNSNCSCNSNSHSGHFDSNKNGVNNNINTIEIEEKNENRIKENKLNEQKVKNNNRKNRINNNENVNRISENNENKGNRSNDQNSVNYSNNSSNISSYNSSNISSASTSNSISNNNSSNFSKSNNSSRNNEVIEIVNTNRTLVNDTENKQKQNFRSRPNSKRRN